MSNEEGGVFEHGDCQISVYPVKRWPNQPTAWSWASISLVDGKEMNSKYEYRSKFAAVAGSMFYADTGLDACDLPPRRTEPAKVRLRKPNTFFSSCPDCGSTGHFHRSGCKYEYLDR
jgi:hypothetical protein